jgi:hypothetical protein
MKESKVRKKTNNPAASCRLSENFPSLDGRGLKNYFEYPPPQGGEEMNG